MRYQLGEDEQLSAHYDNAEARRDTNLGLPTMRLLTMATYHGYLLWLLTMPTYYAYLLWLTTLATYYGYTCQVTLNINLGLNFEGGELLFHGRRQRAGQPTPAGAAARPLWFEWEEVGSGVRHLASIRGRQRSAATVPTMALRTRWAAACCTSASMCTRPYPSQRASGST